MVAIFGFHGLRGAVAPAIAALAKFATVANFRIRPPATPP